MTSDLNPWLYSRCVTTMCARVWEKVRWGSGREAERDWVCHSLNEPWVEILTTQFAKNKTDHCNAEESGFWLSSGSFIRTTPIYIVGSLYCIVVTALLHQSFDCKRATSLKQVALYTNVCFAEWNPIKKRGCVFGLETATLKKIHKMKFFLFFETSKA